MGQIGTPFTSSAEAIGMTALFGFFTAIFACVNYDDYSRNESNLYALASMSMCVAITGVVLNNSYHYFTDNIGDL